jgi:hypothetical protein
MCRKKSVGLYALFVKKKEKEKKSVSIISLLVYFIFLITNFEVLFYNEADTIFLVKKELNF